jgi:hypothetical protein
VAGGDSRPVHLLAAMDHASRTVLAQRQVGGAPAYQLLLEPLDLAGVVVTADALQPHPDAAQFLVATKRATTCCWSRPTSRPCWTAASSPGTASRCWTAPAIAATVASSCAPRRP